MPVPTFSTPPASLAESHHRRPRHVAHVHVVAALGPVAEDPAFTSLEELPEEDRHHAGLTMRILAGSVDVAEPKRHMRRAVEPRERTEVALPASLAAP